MAQGFGTPSAKPKGLTEKGQWKTYQALVLKGEPTVSVMVRIPDKKDAKWYGVGRVNAGGEGTIAQAIEHQKRLIMEHARRVHAPLKGFKGAFDIGLQADPELEPFVHTNERVEVPPTLVACVDPKIFLPALDAAGTFGITTLFGIIPAVAAYRQREGAADGEVYVPGGAATLGAMVAISAAVLGEGVLDGVGVL